MISPSYLKRFVQSQSRLLKTDVTLHWQERTGAEFDRVLQEYIGGTRTSQSEVVQAIIHFVNDGDYRVHYYSELKVSDLLVLFDDDIVLEGRPGLYFDVGGQHYEMKPLGDELPKTYESIFQGLKVGRRVVLQLKA